MNDDIVTRLRRSTWRDCIEAADEIERLRRNIGCARNQHSTQFCAEALDAQREVETLKAELVRKTEELQQQYRWHHLTTDAFAAEKEAIIREYRKVQAERDEARRRVCDDSLRMGSVFRRVDGRTVECSTPQDVAQMMGWDCFKEAGK